MLLEEIESVDYKKLRGEIARPSPKQTPRSGIPHQVCIRELVEKLALQPTTEFRAVFMSSMEETPCTNTMVISELKDYARDTEVALEISGKPATVSHLLHLYEGHQCGYGTFLVNDHANMVLVNRISEKYWEDELWFVWIIWQPVLSEWSIGCKKANSDHYICEGCRFIHPE